MTFTLLRRELLVQGRERGTYWFRVLMVGLGVIVFTWLWAMQSLAITSGRSGMRPQEISSWIIGSVHGGLMLILSLGGALLTADCLAKERREGTLELLFLTPLGAGDIALGKCASQLVRLFGFWLSVLPLMAVPLMLGGVTPRNLFDALLAESSAALTGVAAGLLASAYGRRWGATLSMAMVWLGSFYASHAVISWAVGFVKIVLVQSKSLDGYFLMMLPVMPLIVGIGLPLEGPMGAAGAGTEVAMGRVMLLWMSGWSLLLFTTVMLLLYGVLARGQEEVPARRVTPLQKAQWKGGQRPPALALREVRRAGRFPYYSLETRTRFFGQGSAWLAIGTSLIWLIVLADRPQDSGWFFALGYLLIPLLLLVAVAMSGASFYREREEGALEMLLATPLTPRELVFGRLGAIARGLAPALLAGLFWMSLVMRLRNHESDFGAYLAFVLPAGLAAMALAMRAAVRGWKPLASSAFGLGLGIALPHIGMLVGWSYIEWFHRDVWGILRGQQTILWMGILGLYQMTVTVICFQSVLQGFRECAPGLRRSGSRWFSRRSGSQDRLKELEPF